jgi:Sigma54-dependent transcription regulator containing an AAA-type ATPase domain and a DNA-binding domain
MATLAEGGHITESLVAAEIERLRKAWGGSNAPDKTGSIDLQQWVPQETLSSTNSNSRLLSASAKTVAALPRPDGRCLMSAGARSRA